jgi:hypothetical protein
MIKNLLSITLTLIISSSITGCFLLSTRGNNGEVLNQEVKGCQQENIEAPEWTCKPIVDGFYSAVGIVEESSSGMEYTRKVALTEGRYNLAQDIKAKVKSKVENFILKTKIGDDYTAQSINMDVSKAISKIDLSRSTGIMAWSAPSKNLYMLVTLPQNDVNDIAKVAVINSLKKSDSLWQEFMTNNDTLLSNLRSDSYMEELEEEFPITTKKKIKIKK